jgi:cell division protein ZapA
MAQVTIEVNGKPYTVGCEDGQEHHLTPLASLFDHQVRQISADVGQLGETRLFLMGALLVADELADAKARLAQAQAELSRAHADRARAEGRAVSAIDQAAERIEQLAAH